MLDDASALFERARGRRILVVGDLMVDEWIWGTVTRISPEAPVPVVAVSDHSFTLGGAGNVANNLRALDASVTFAGTVGDDAFADHVRELLRAEQVDDAGVVTLSGRATTRKTRVVAHNQQVVRADWESVSPPDGTDRRAHRRIRPRTRRFQRCGDPKRLCEGADVACPGGGGARVPAGGCRSEAAKSAVCSRA